jgi:hypothetical protein
MAASAAARATVPFKNPRTSRIVAPPSSLGIRSARRRRNSVSATAASVPNINSNTVSLESASDEFPSGFTNDAA